MRKRERENPCGVCGHYHKYEEGEVCGICGHRMPDGGEKTSIQVSAFPSEILPEFLYLGSYDNASRSELLKTQGISRILNTVPACQNLYKNSFTYHCLQDDQNIPFDDAMTFLEQCEKDRARVLVHCMLGKNRMLNWMKRSLGGLPYDVWQLWNKDAIRPAIAKELWSPAIVVAYLMKNKGWRLGQSYQWVKERRLSVDITPAVYQQLQDYELKIFGNENLHPTLSGFSSSGAPVFSFGFPKPSDAAPIPVFNNTGATSIFARSTLDVPPQEFTFGATQTRNTSGLPLGVNPPNTKGDVPMDGS